MEICKPRPPEEPEYNNADFNARALSKLKVYEARRHLVLKPNEYPRFLYKYFSDVTKDEYLNDVIIDCDLYLNSPDDFNDPFDTSAKLVCESTPSELRKRFSDIVKKRSSEVTKKEREGMVTNMMVKHSANNNEWISDTFKKNTSSAGVFCMTTDPRNILMWSHYGGKHKGVVLQFEIARDPRSLLYALKVHYSNEYPIYNYAYEMDTDTFNAVMLRKAEAWRYEEEWRILRVGGAHTFQPFKPHAMTGVIFGCKATENFKEKIRHLIKRRQEKYGQDIKFFQSIQNGSKYAVSISSEPRACKTI